MRYRATKVPAPFVQVDEGAVFLEILMEAGPVKSAPMGGFAALDWVDIAAYVELTMDRFEPWEASLLRRMSQAYAAGLTEGADPFSISPVERKEK